MKTKTFVPFLAVASWLAGSTTLFAQGTAFTYQGRLNQNDSPATGIYDFRFTIYDSIGGPTVIAGPQTMSGTGVTNGVLTVSLDFGAGVFTGPGRWLEIGVRPAGGASYTNLSPRQPLRPTPYAMHAGSASNVANGSVVKSLNNLRDNVTLAAGANVMLTPNGNTVTISSTGVGGNTNIWNLSGANTYYSAGNVGIGTGTPARKLSVRTAPADYGIEHTDGDVRLDTYVNPAGAFLGTVSNHKLHLFVNDAGSRLTVDTTGNVGIGSTTPNHRLRISGGPSWTTAFWGGALELDNAAAIGWGANAAGNRFGIGQSTGGLYFFNTASDPGTTANPANYLMTVTDNGNVGIGTILPATKLTVNSSLYGIEHTDGIVRLNTYLDWRGGWLGTVSNHKLHFYVNDGLPSITVDTTKNVGIGTQTPLTKLHVAGSGIIEGAIQSTDERAILSLNGLNRVWTLESGVFGTPGLFGIYDRGSGRARLTIDTAGVVAVDVLRINGGADLSENFDVRGAKHENTDAADIEPGMVVSIDSENPGKLAVSQQGYDHRVAGIISGAGGVKPGMLMGQEGSIASGKHPVALTGRVYVHADATCGAIQPGDLLTTSDTPGHAMKVRDHAKAQGAILGKAMSSLKEGKGMVLVLVTLQ